MTRQEYMQQLAALLAAMPEAERRDALDYYEEYFDAAGPEKEAQTIQELGSPQNVAEKIWEGTGAQSGTPMPDNSMPEQGSRRRKSPVWIVLAVLAILIVVLLVFIGSFKIVTKYQYSIAESATAEEAPPAASCGGSNRKYGLKHGLKYRNSHHKGKYKKRKHQPVGKQHDDAGGKAGPNDGIGPGLRRGCFCAQQCSG